MTLRLLGTGARLTYLRRLDFSDDDCARSPLLDRIDDGGFDRGNAWLSSDVLGDSRLARRMFLESFAFEATRAIRRACVICGYP